MTTDHSGWHQVGTNEPPNDDERATSRDEPQTVSYLVYCILLPLVTTTFTNVTALY